MIYARAKEIDRNTTTEAEALAILEACRLGENSQFSHFLVQTDSLLLRNFTGGSWKPSWHIIAWIDEIKDIMRRCNIQITLILGVGNKLTNY